MICNIYLTVNLYLSPRNFNFFNFQKPASGEDDNAAPAAGLSTLPPLYAAVDKVAQQKEQDAVSHFELYFKVCKK